MEFKSDIKANIEAGFVSRQLPIKIIKDDSRAGMVSIVAGVVFCLIGVLTSVSVWNNRPHDVSGYILQIFTLTGLILLILGIKMRSYREEVTIDSEKVTMRKRTFSGFTEWTERIIKYKGLLYRAVFHAATKNNPSYTMHIFELVHDDTSRNIVVCEIRSTESMRKMHEEYCRMLNIPAVVMDAGAVEVRDAVDLDKSIKQLADEGKLDVDFDPGKPAPAGVKLRIIGDDLEITMHRKLNAGAFVSLLAVALIMIFAGYGTKTNAPLWFIIGAIMLFIAACMCISSYMIHEQVIVRKESVDTQIITPWKAIAANRMYTKFIEDVRVDKSIKTGIDVLYIESDEKVMTIGEGMSVETLQWIKRCILKVMTT